MDKGLEGIRIDNKTNIKVIPFPLTPHKEPRVSGWSLSFYIPHDFPFHKVHVLLLPLDPPPLTVCAFIFLTFIPLPPPPFLQKQLLLLVLLLLLLGERTETTRTTATATATESDKTPSQWGKSSPCGTSQTNLTSCRVEPSATPTTSHATSILHQELTNWCNKLHCLPFDFIILTLCGDFTVVQGSFRELRSILF